MICAVIYAAVVSRLATGFQRADYRLSCMAKMGAISEHASYIEAAFLCKTTILHFSRLRRLR